MRKILLSLVITLISTGFATAQTKILISTKNYKAEKINIAWLADDGEYNVKGIEIKNGKGEVTIDATEGKNLNLVSLDPRSQIEMDEGIVPGPSFAFYAEKGTIKISFDAEQWPILTIEGGDLSKDCNNYWSLMAPIERASFELSRKDSITKANQPNKPAPKFSKKDKDGKVISLDNLKGKYILIDF